MFVPQMRFRPAMPMPVQSPEELRARLQVSVKANYASYGGRVAAKMNASVPMHLSGGAASIAA